MRERRTHARVAIPLDARVEVHGVEHTLVVRELSRSGIFLFGTKPFAEVGERVVVKLAIVAGIHQLVLHAEVLRTTTRRSGKMEGTALKFVDMTLDRQEALLELIDRGMRGPGTGDRAFPRVSQCLRVTYGSGTELEVLLCDIGEGGAGLELNRPVKLEEEIALDIAFDGLPRLQLKGFVVTCERLADAPREAYKVGVRFGRLDPELRQTLISFLKSLYRRR